MMYEYRIIESNRKTVSIQVTHEGEVIIRAPFRYSRKKIERFINDNLEWIERSKIKQREIVDNMLKLTQEDIKSLKMLAEKVINEKVYNYSQIMGVKPTGIKITSAQKRFGSCNSKNSLCFSYTLMLYPDEAIDYVVVHELAHIKHHNHSKEFYKLVSDYLPDYKKREALLKSKQTMPDFS